AVSAAASRLGAQSTASWPSSRTWPWGRLPRPRSPSGQQRQRRWRQQERPHPLLGPLFPHPLLLPLPCPWPTLSMIVVRNNIGTARQAPAGQVVGGSASALETGG
ncbi:unnamed protein product, partial [Discosporangium mesarthrocarpum]